VTHWHISATTPKFGIISDVRYDNGAKSVLDYVEVVYGMFIADLEEEDKTIYLSNMLNLTENSEHYHIYTASDKLILSWADCQDDPCIRATYN
jgi:hypothetical protein